MEKTKILILEDNTFQAWALEKMLTDFGYEVTGKAASGERALQLFKEKSPDLVLLDIRVEGRIDGIEVGKIITQLRPVPIIYLTARDDEFKRAMVTHPAAFFCKPYNERDLLNQIELAIHNFVNQLDLSNTKPTETALLSNIYFSTDCLWLKTKSGGPFERLPISDILFIKSSNVYLDLLTKNRPTPFTLTLGIGEFAARAAYPQQLVQIHRCYIVNVAHITRFTTTKAVIAGEHEIPVSRTYFEAFRDALLGR